MQEAYEVLSDSELRRAYDYGGMDMLDKVKKQKSEQENFQRQREANQEKFYGNQQDRIQDVLENSPINSLGPKEMSKFERRWTSWLLMFYRNDDDHLKILTPAIQKIREDFSGIIEVAKVNCDLHDQFCRDFMVYSTPKLQIFSSFSGVDPKEFDYHNYLDFLEENQTKKFLAVLSKEMMESVEDYVQFLNNETLPRFQNSPKQKVALLTQKNQTPILWKVLSKEFRSYLDFGIIKPSSGSLYE